MTQAAFHNQESFERAIGVLIEQADAQNRGQDVDRVYKHFSNRPAGVSDLASLLFVIDEDFRPQVTQAVEAYRRFLKTKGRPAEDKDIAEAILRVYKAKRGL